MSAVQLLSAYALTVYALSAIAIGVAIGGTIDAIATVVAHRGRK